jgi:hypothetical protein
VTVFARSGRAETAACDYRVLSMAADAEQLPA